MFTSSPRHKYYTDSAGGIDEELLNDEEFIINEAFILPNSEINDVYQKCLKWLTNVKAAIIDKKEPTFIHAFQHDWKKKYRPLARVIKITLKKESTGVVVIFHKLSSNTGEWHESWFRVGCLVLEFCEYMEIDEAQIQNVWDKIVLQRYKEKIVFIK